MTVTSPAALSATHDLPALPYVEVRLGEDLDIATLASLQDQLDDAVLLRPARLVIDFTACRYLDAQAIRLLVETHGALWREGGRLVLRDCSEDTLRLLSLAGVLEIFEVETSQASTK